MGTETRFRTTSCEALFLDTKREPPELVNESGGRLAASSRRGARFLGRSAGFCLEVAHLATDLADCLLLELTDSFTRQVVLVTDFLQRELVLVVEAETPANDARFDGREGVEQALDLFCPFLVCQALIGR